MQVEIVAHAYATSFRCTIAYTIFCYGLPLGPDINVSASVVRRPSCGNMSKTKQNSRIVTMEHYR